MEVYFEFAVESGKMSDGEYKTPQDALTAANEKWQDMCEEGDYEYGDGDCIIFCVDTETADVVMQGEYKVYSEYDIDPDYGTLPQSAFI